MVASFFDPATAPFAVALIVMLAIAAAEIVGAMFGVAPSGVLDSMLPDLEVDAGLSGAGSPLDADAPSMPDAPGAGPLSAVLGWLCVGKVPILVLLIAFLTVFGLTGFAVQGLSGALFGFALPSALAAVPALAAAIPATRASGLVLSRILPKEQTEAVSSASFVGRIAVITRGDAREGLAAEAKMTDSFGQTHYVLVEPDEPGAVLASGSAVLLVRQAGSRFRAIDNPNPMLTDHDPA
ncbi:YqiJ family protein [Hyphomonadaceae bacterium BL14]|nr:YqiJ family protein [Hyphomonadaceae bacterium BL14]